MEEEYSNKNNSSQSILMLMKLYVDALNNDNIEEADALMAKIKNA